MNKFFKYLLSFIVIIVLLNMCSDDDDYKKSPLDEYIVQFSSEKRFSVILEDMDVDGTFFKTYKHKYKVIRHNGDTPYEETSDWKEVSEDFFARNENNLGMTVLTKSEEGKISKAAQPPGYEYVGNKRYGQWRNNSGGSFWAFYGQYMFMSNMFGMMSRPIYRNHYDSYRTGGYYGSRSYYGPKGTGGTSMYGTNSAQTRKSRPNFFSRRASKSGWSGSRSRSGSSRSRGSGFGK